MVITPAKRVSKGTYFYVLGLEGAQEKLFCKLHCFGSISLLEKERKKGRKKERKKERKKKERNKQTYKQTNKQTNKGFSFGPKHPVDPEYNKPKHAQPVQAKFLFPC